MGNQASALGDEPASDRSAAINHNNFQHFDHSFKGELHTTNGKMFTEKFGACSFAKRPIQVICKGTSFEIIEEISITSSHTADVPYQQITALSWDHANSEVKIEIIHRDEPNFVILTMAISIEFEGELKLRLSGIVAATRSMKMPSTTYVGMFAGATKPKPFQRKRPNLSHLLPGKLPPLHDMRSLALQLHKGSYRPCPPGESRRMELAVQHIFEGQNTFNLLSVRGHVVQHQWRSESVLLIKEDMLVFKSSPHSGSSVDFAFADIDDWTAVDNEDVRRGDSGIEITSKKGDKVLFCVPFLRDVKHTLEFFWNKYQVANGDSVKLGSTHGRPIVSVSTLSGEMHPPEPPVGQSEVVDQDGIIVRPGARMIPRKTSLAAGIISSGEPKVVPSENRDVKKHWHKIVLHQGWLLKKGGVGVGQNKSWIKRYFVLYSTSQGHFLAYYSDFTECPLYTNERNQRNVVDIAKTTFIRPGSNKADYGDTPPHSFDIVTTEREWTLCAESQENVQKWLRLLTRAVDEDVAILPDEELIFKVKPKVDPVGILPANDYSTSLKISANGVSVCTPDTSGSSSALSYGGGGPEREHYFWVYTDFYKWSLLSQNGKLALLVNVFADSSFSRRNEYIFRNKEATRLATAIEFFIEKFMSVMHIRLETTEGAFDDAAELGEGGEVGGGGVSSGMHEMNGEEWADDENADEVEQQEPEQHQYQQQQNELNLLDLDIDSPPVPPQPQPQKLQPAAVPVQTRGPAAVAASVDPFGGSLIGDDDPSAGNGAGGFGADPFGDDPFGESPFSVGEEPAVTEPAVAPPLTPAQVAQHRVWLQSALASSGGPLYDDGTLQMAVRVEVRGSQGRVTLFYRNQGPEGLSELQVSLLDPSGLLRYQLGTLTSKLNSMAKTEQQILMECMKPTSPGPQICIEYEDPVLGKHSNTIDLPISVASFNEPLVLSGQDFSMRWAQLVGPGQEIQEVFRPTSPVEPDRITAAMTSALKFGRVSGVADESEFVVYGAASLRTGALSPAGEKISVGCLVKVEMNVQANALRITLRTLHPAASSSLMAAARALLA